LRNAGGGLSFDGMSNRQLSGLADILKTADTLQRGMPVAYLLAFILVALEEGRGVIEYARRAGVDRFAMSRYLALLGDGQNNKGGYGWVKLRRNGISKSVVLTPKGYVFLSKISHELKGRRSLLLHGKA
jgi:hypothetical protein